ncbi:MAG: carbohydrate ABC transporter permease [Candidatus Izemoplasmatales bacterium]|jgi:multiple sugar transport system permease protein
MDSAILKKKKKKEKIAIILIVIFLSVLALMQLFPFYLKIVTSLQPTKGFNPIDGKIYLWPESLNFQNYIQAIKEGELLEGTLNTIIVSVSFIILSSIIILLVSYATAKKKFRGKKLINFVLLLTMMVPGEMLMVTNYQLISQLNWTSTFRGLILPGIVNVTGIFLVKAFMNTIPDACIEHAKIDGANEWQILIRIIFPMSLPVMSTYAILTFVAQWNDYLWPMLITGNDDLFTIQLKLLNFASNGGFEETVLRSASLILTMLPVIIIYSIFQRKFVNGLNFSGIKE